MNSSIFAGNSNPPLYGTHISKDGILCKAKNTTKCITTNSHTQHVVELCEFIADDWRDETKKEQARIEGKKNKFKHLGIIKTGSGREVEARGKNFFK